MLSKQAELPRRPLCICTCTRIPVRHWLRGCAALSDSVGFVFRTESLNGQGLSNLENNNNDDNNKKNWPNHLSHLLPDSKHVQIFLPTSHAERAFEEEPRSEVTVPPPQTHTSLLTPPQAPTPPPQRRCFAADCENQYDMPLFDTHTCGPISVFTHTP